jgi:hemerythrin superfamily protein
MSPRQSKSGSRATGRTRGARSGKRAGGRAANDTRRAAAGGRGPQAGRRTPARAKRGRRSGSSAGYALKLLQQDHRAVAAALTQFASAAHEEKRQIARRICAMLKVHTQMEEELLYPAARDVLGAQDAHLVAEARVEHAAVKDLIAQIEAAEEVDEQYEARVRVMGEFVKHHVREEETELFPQLARTPLDLDALGERLAQRKRELVAEQPHDGQGLHDEEESAMPRNRSRGGGRGHRSASLHARRR